MIHHSILITVGAVVVLTAAIDLSMRPRRKRRPRPAPPTRRETFQAVAAMLLSPHDTDADAFIAEIAAARATVSRELALHSATVRKFTTAASIDDPAVGPAML
jgi:hypothetical protein